MGLFSSIFGSGGSDKADKLRQQAMDAFNSVKTPELAALQIQLSQYVNAGKLTPAQAEAALLNSNAFNAIATDPANTAAQKQALIGLQQVANQGGMTAIDKARMQDITDSLEQQNRSQNEATMQQARMRGTGGSDLTTVNQLINEQGAADRAARSGTDVAANAQARALQAMQAAGTLGGQIRGQEYGEAANKAQAQNALDIFNKQALNQTNLYNVQAKNAAEAANLANAQAVNNANTATTNANKEYNAQANQTVFEDQLRKAQGISGVEQNAAADAERRAEQERNASAGLISGALQGGAVALGSAFGGPAGGAAAGSMAPHAPPSYAPTNEDQLPGYAEGGDVTDPEHPNHMANGGHVHCYAYGGEAHHHPDCYMNKGGFLSGLKKGALHKDLGVPQGEKIPAKKIEKATHSTNETLRKRAQFAENAKHFHHAKEGGEVPGKAKVKGDSPKNDTVTAKLSPGEVVIPRSAANDDEEFHNFMAKFDPHKKKMAMGGIVAPSVPRVNDMNPMRDTVKDTSSNPVPLASTNDFQSFMKKTKTPKKIAAPKVPLEAQALANLHQRVSRLEGGKI